jgi:DNA-binding Xre family transcriptional regulator
MDTSTQDAPLMDALLGWNRRIISMTINRKKIRDLRIRKGFNQTDAARAAGLTTRARWCQYENGDRPLTSKSLGKICKALGCQIQDIIYQ